MTKRQRVLLTLAWWQSIVAMLGSLFFSEVMKWTPCVLCWYQRIAMYPLVAILGVGLYLKDKRVALYAAPLAVIGFVISTYHNLLYYRIIPEAIKPCTLGVSCTTKFFAWFGFVTIPLLSFTAFSIILLLLYIANKKK